MDFHFGEAAEAGLRFGAAGVDGADGGEGVGRNEAEGGQLAEGFFQL